MYAPTYGFPPDASNPQQMPAYNLSAAPQNAQPQTPQQHGQQPLQQHMMYNPQQYPGGHQSPYGGPAGAPMAHSPGLMQNSNGMAHMAGNNGIVQPYQTPYTSSPYGPGMPNSSSGAPQQSYMTPTANSSSFNMNNMTPHQQRMQPPQASTPIPSSQRASPYGAGPLATPPHSQQGSQFMTPQNANVNQQQQQIQIPSQLPGQGQVQGQAPSNQPQSAGTPQTPNFPPSAANANQAVGTPLSPGSANIEKERVSLLLDINRELLMEVMRLQQIQAEAKKESNAAKDEEKTNGEEKKVEKDKPMATTGKEYVECMRRLQSNLAYLAAIADRSHKPDSQIPRHPAIISAPPLSPLKSKAPFSLPLSTSTINSTSIASPKVESTPTSPSKASKSDPSIDNITGDDEKEDRAATLRELYKRLQALFPDFDPKKEPPLQSAKGPPKPGQGQKPPGQQHAPGAGAGGAQTGVAQPGTGGGLVQQGQQVR